MIGVRKSLDFIFTKYELKVLDDLMPESNTKHKEEDEDEEVTNLVSRFRYRPTKFNVGINKTLYYPPGGGDKCRCGQSDANDGLHQPQWEKHSDSAAQWKHHEHTRR
jgi:hypothetical protein